MSEQKQCRACDHPRDRSGRYGCVRTSWSAMKAQAKLGCVPCGILSEGIEKVLQDEKSQAGDDEEDWQLRLDFNMHGAEGSLEFVVINTGTVVTFFCSEVTPWLSKTLPDLPVAFDVPRQTSSPKSIAWVRQQIKECQRSHPACIGLNIRSTFPQRVIDVQSDPIRLYESKGEHGPYICLSHVWGDRPFLRTTKDNFAAHKKAIDFASLPPTFQQAVRYTQELGVRYLWIDSLCIIQDDPHDWEIQASSMALIFQDSFLVLSAARSPNAYGGLYAEFPSRCRTHIVEVTTEAAGDGNSTTEKVYARRSLAHLNSGRFMNQWLDSWHTNVLLPTLTRGWIFQERFLAPRVLHFGPEELSWECLRHSTCQCTSPPSPSQSPQTANRGTTNHDKASNDSSISAKIISKIDLPAWHKQAITRITRPKSYYNFWAWMALARKPGAVTAKSHNDELTDCWHHLVEDYTKLQLTFEKDVFPAVSGLAHLMWTALDSREKPSNYSNPLVRKNVIKRGGMMSVNRYFAGLWSHSLHRDILWRVGDQITPRRPDKWRAPSWSWASVKGAVEFLDQTEGMRPKCEVLEDVDCALAGIDNFGELVDVSGKNILALKGTVLRSGLSFKGSASGLADNEEWKKNVRAWEVMELDIFKGHLKNVWADDCDTERPSGGEKNQEVYCLLVGVKKSNALCFLILKRVEEGPTEADGAGEMYQRVGVAEVFGGPAGPGSWKDRLFADGNVQTVRIR